MTATIVPADARKSELTMYRQKYTGPCTEGDGANSVRKLSRLIVCGETSAGGGRNVYLFSASLSLNVAHTSHTNGSIITVPTTPSSATRPYANAARRENGKSAT